MTSEFSSSAPLSSDTVKSELMTEDIIEIIINQLTGMRYDPTTQKMVQKGVRLVSDYGAKKIGTVLAAYVSRDKILTILSHDDIKLMTQELCEAMIINLTLKYREYGVAPADLGIVMAIIESTVYSNLMRSLDGRTLEHIEGMVKVSEHENNANNLPRLPNMPFGRGDE